MRFSSVVIGFSLLMGTVGAGAAPRRIDRDDDRMTRVEVMPPAPRPAPVIDREELHRKLAIRRLEMMKRFLAYREARVYPLNSSGQPTAEHIWLDQDGHLCAAATLISKDWGKAGTVRAAGGNNAIALAEVTTGPLADWMLTSGFTHHEIVAIQVPAMPMPDRQTETQIRQAEIERLHGIYVDVERQLKALLGESLDEATDALMARPELAAQFMAGKLPSAPPAPPKPVAVNPSGMKFAQPPPG